MSIRLSQLIRNIESDLGTGVYKQLLEKANELADGLESYDRNKVIYRFLEREYNDRTKFLEERR